MAFPAEHPLQRHGFIGSQRPEGGNDGPGTARGSVVPKRSVGGGEADFDRPVQVERWTIVQRFGGQARQKCPQLIGNVLGSPCG